MRFVQLVLSEEHAQLAAEAIDQVLVEQEQAATAAAPSEKWEEERKQLGRVQVLLSDAVLHPEKYPPTGKSAATVKSVVKRALAGEAQPTGRKNKRKARQERRMRTSKERRKFRKQIAENFNRSREIYEQEAKEAEEFHTEVEERVSSQPKFRVTTATGETVLAGIPAEFLINEETGDSVLSTDYFKPQIIVPGTA